MTCCDYVVEIFEQKRFLEENKHEEEEEKNKKKKSCLLRRQFEDFSQKNGHQTASVSKHYKHCGVTTLRSCKRQVPITVFNMC